MKKLKNLAKFPDIFSTDESTFICDDMVKQ